MLEPPELLNSSQDTFDMHFYILTKNAEQWPAIRYATVLEASNKQFYKLTFTETGLMDILLICSPPANIPLTYRNKLASKFRIVLNLSHSTDNLSNFQDTIGELCWASHHSHNFDILDASNLLNGVTPIITANATMIENGWQPAQHVDTAIVLLHPLKQASKQDIDNYLEQVSAALNIKSLAAISFGDSRAKSTCNYSVLAK
ncbi:TPA: hypothetical protein KD865_002089 [Vibrio parahaemolyticus]|nr:hypothetical protein [Vibrio parahaemolyticus]